MSDRAYTSMKAMTRAAALVARSHGAPKGIAVRRNDTDRPIYSVCESLIDGGIRDLFTGTARECRAYLRGVADAHYWADQAT